MKISKWDSTFTYWKEVGAHNCRLKSSLRMGFGWLVDTNKKTLFSKIITKKLKEANGTGINIKKRPLFHIYHFFPLEWLKHAFFNLLF